VEKSSHKKTPQLAGFFVPVAKSLQRYLA